MQAHHIRSGRGVEQTCMQRIHDSVSLGMTKGLKTVAPQRMRRKSNSVFLNDFLDSAGQEFHWEWLGHDVHTCLKSAVA
ncbi:hypothetical protein GCM10009425_01510 [Pseudomonas asuensis]|uniref:Uncharacterized protein n=1 Tax=Pseudomonas asuensis TaxID=1825787 RepID=A0ABQ2GFQ7_9PSED|nr:hypothetical protein GCM10009425_01510 [Pseudomonas asuensis]